MKLKKWNPLYNTLHEAKLLEWVETIKVSNDLLDNLETMYEWVYKYNKIKDFAQKANPKRLKNIFKEIEKRIKPVLDNITTSLSDVFSNWLANHALNDPERWAYSRVNELEESGLDLAEIVKSLKAEYERYAYSDDFAIDAIAESDELKNYLEEYKTELIDNEKATLYDEYDYDFDNPPDEIDEDYEEDIQQLLSSIESLEETEFNHWEDCKDFIETFYGESVDDFFDNLNYDYFGNNLALEISEKVVFPVWFDHWKNEGIVQTKNNIEKISIDLEKSERERDLSKRMMTIHIALNTQHQTGGMIDYIENEYDVSKRDLDELSSMGNKGSKVMQKWDKEVGMMGIF
jgi:hypothetical protein